MLRRTLEFFFPPSVSTPEELKAFAAGEASYLAQKTVIGYCRVKTMLDYEKLLTEPAFRDAQESCRWEAYAGTLGDMLIMIEGWLRPGAEPARQRLADSLVAFYPAILGEHVPSHRQDWADSIAAFERRFALARASEPAAPEQVVTETAKLIHELVPIADRLKRNDREVINGDLRLHMLAAHSSMMKRFRRDALVAALTT
ncbi:MAG: hypothetical protein OJJ21_14515 [Ferrovibrio sp.]|uniref:hypothetical protein n=1 Tax=Ferrovibrio sp. TaxID=1917215 RepID=UPI0026103F92|nr:hypothetical protein [Ferrovibrio sp.]MCW0234810.1 hypothetical protein [Ferrovibrio sp.]